MTIDCLYIYIIHTCSICSCDDTVNKCCLHPPYSSFMICMLPSTILYSWFVCLQYIPHPHIHDFSVCIYYSILWFVCLRSTSTIFMICFLVSTLFIFFLIVSFIFMIFLLVSTLFVFFCLYPPRRITRGTK